MFKKLGGFNTVYDPFYWEDIDLSFRAKKCGYIILFEPKSVVIHEHREGAILSKYSKKNITRISYRNQFIFVWNNATFFQLLVHIMWLPYHLFVSLVRDRELFLAFFSALSHFISYKLFFR
jgi:GT2 family glycosyltransferase